MHGILGDIPVIPQNHLYSRAEWLVTYNSTIAFCCWLFSLSLNHIFCWLNLIFNFVSWLKPIPYCLNPRDDKPLAPAPSGGVEIGSQRASGFSVAELKKLAASLGPQAVSRHHFWPQEIHCHRNPMTPAIVNDSGVEVGSRNDFPE